MDFSVSKRQLARWLWSILLVIVAVRLVTLALYPLMGTTEPRYAEISRKMLATGDWVTPWYEDGRPFWGKPPMSFWGSSTTMALFGVNEFAARLAPLLASLGCFALLWTWPKPINASPLRSLLPVAAAVVGMSTLGGFVAAGVVMTDMFLTLGTTLCMVAFWVSVNDSSGTTLWRWLFFVGIAVGLLAKGPIATVLTGVAIALWVIAGARTPGGLAQRWHRIWTALPWWRGSALALLLALPWYVLAEQHTPGFLKYFIVGEHIERFLVPGWTGDLYGQGHEEARGKIWPFALVLALPWLLLQIALWLGKLRRRDANQQPTWVVSGERSYLLAWILSPLLFFTVARNILPSYTLPGLPAYALQVGLAVLPACERNGRLRFMWLLGLFVPLGFCAFLILRPGYMSDRSQRDLLQNHWTLNQPLVYLEGRPLSADFYSRGQAITAATPKDIAHWLQGPAQINGKPVTIVVEHQVYARLPADELRGWNVVAQHGGFLMLRR